MRYLGMLTLAIVILSVSGCFETEENYVINPDGSGKVKLNILLTPGNFSSTSTPDPEAEKQKALANMLEDSEGVQAWKDVSSAIEDDGRIRLEGTAYFKDFSKLKIRYGDMTSDMKFFLEKTHDGGLVLKFNNKEGRKVNREVEMPEEEIERQIKAQKMQYQKMKPMMESVMKNVKQTFYFKLPGTLGEYSNFKKTEDGRLGLTLDGEKFLKTLEKLMSDDDWWRKQIIAGHDLEDLPLHDEINEKLFGQKAPVQAVVSGDLEPLFDYDAQVRAAQKAYPELLKKLGLQDKIATAPADESGLKSLKVGGVRLVKFSDGKNKIRPFNRDEGYALSLVGEFSGSVLKVQGGSLEKAVADNGQDLLPERKWDRKISFPSLSEDKTFVIFEIKLELPGPDVTCLEEVSGFLEYTVASGTRELDLGIGKFAPGAEGSELSAKIKKIEQHSWEKEKQQLELALQCELDKVKEFRFLDKDGSKLDVEKRGHFSSGTSAQVTFTIKGEFPEEGKIILVLHDKVKKYKTPFKLSDITLTGEPRK